MGIAPWLEGNISFQHFKKEKNNKTFINLRLNEKIVFLTPPKKLIT